MQDTDIRIKVYARTGPCLLDVDQVVARWNQNTFITKYNGEYTLTEVDADGNRMLKVRIYTEQAKEIIERLNLRKELRPFFNAGVWHS